MFYSLLGFVVGSVMVFVGLGIGEIALETCSGGFNYLKDPEKIRRAEARSESALTFWACVAALIAGLGLFLIFAAASTVSVVRA